jgi:hypothetical protein
MGFLHGGTPAIETAALPTEAVFLGVRGVLASRLGGWRACKPTGKRREELWNALVNKGFGFCAANKQHLFEILKLRSLEASEDFSNGLGGTSGTF